MRKITERETRHPAPLVRPASVFFVGNQWGKSSPFSQRLSFKFALPPSLSKIRPPLPGNSTLGVVLFFSEVAATTSEVVSTAPRARTHYTMQRAFCFHCLHPREISLIISAKSEDVRAQVSLSSVKAAARLPSPAIH